MGRRTRSPQYACRFIEVRVRRVRPHMECYAIGGSRPYQRRAAHYHGPDCLRGVIKTIEIGHREFKREARLIDDPDGSGCGGPDSAVVPARDFHGSTRNRFAFLMQILYPPERSPW